TNRLRRNASRLPSGLGWPTAPPLHGAALITLQPLLEHLITHHPVRAPDRLLLRILLHQKLTPTPLAAAVVYAPFHVLLRAGSLWGLPPRAPTDPGVQISRTGSSSHEFAASACRWLSLTRDRSRCTWRVSFHWLMRRHPLPSPRSLRLVPLGRQYYGILQLPAVLLA